MNDIENSPISALPTELLIYICKIGVDDEFEEALPVLSNPLRGPQTPFIYPLVQVCHLWRQVVRHTPALWSTLAHFDNYPRDVIMEILHLSASTPLHIRLSCGMRSRFIPPSNIHLLEGYALRIRTLNATSHSSTIPDDFLALLEKPMPRLRNLSLRYGHGAWTLANPTTAIFPSTTFLGNTASSLHTLVLKECRIDRLSSVELPRLRILVINSLHSPFDYSISDWLATLNNMTGLEEFHVKGSIRPEDSDLMGSQVLELPSLRVFCYTDTDLAGLRLIRWLQLPSLQLLKIEIEISDTESVSLSRPQEVTGALRRTLFGWGEKLDNHVLKIDLGQNQASIRTFSSIDFPTKNETAKMELMVKWKGTWTRDIQIKVNAILMDIIISIRESLHRISTLISRHDAQLGTIDDFMTIQATLWCLLTSMPCTRNWVMGSEEEFARSVFQLYKFSPNLCWPLLDTIVLKDVDSPSDELCDFVRERRRDGKPISALQINGKTPHGYDEALGCRIERDALVLDEVMIWPNCQVYLNV